MRYVYIVIGTLSLGIGAIGAAIPLLPSFPFLMLAAFCYAKSSKRLHEAFISSKLYKNNLESYVKKEGMTLKTKIKIMVIVTIGLTLGFIMMDQVPVGRIVLILVWLGHVLYFMFRVKTIPAK